MKTIQSICLTALVATFLANPAALPAADAAAGKSEAAGKVKPYPLKTCVVSGEEIDEKGAMKPYSFVYQGQEIKLCCESCKKDFDKNPKKYLGMIEKAAKEAEKKKSKKS